MSAFHDPDLQLLLGIVVGVLVAATIIGQILKRVVAKGPNHDTVTNLNARVKGWWFMCAVFAVALMTGKYGTIALFGLLSVLALREFVTLTPSNRADHKSLIWVFFIFTPVQYWLVSQGNYGLFSVLIPVYAFFVIATRNATMGDTDRFLERTATIQWALLACTYCVSHVPALLTMKIPNYEHNAKLLLFFVVVSQASDVFQYIFGKLFGKHHIAPSISPNKTWEGFAGGVACATAAGAGMWFATPFSPLEAGGLSLAITLLGFAGGLVMSAIKRDRGVKDYGTLIQGHGGVLDRIDSMIFAAPIFYHLTRYYFAG